jgi:glycosyltransferase involved in cell wall biosynthesis
MMEIRPIVAIIPTASRHKVLLRTLQSISSQLVQPVKIVIIDASPGDETKHLCETVIAGLNSKIVYDRAKRAGAAAQRNQGMLHCDTEFVLFMDDDIILESDCIDRLWSCLSSDTTAGGVNAMITNQKYHTPGTLTRFMYHMMSGRKLDSYAGKCIGPAWNLLPEDNPALGNCNPVEWLNTTCTLYRKSALPEPVFQPHFTGYSLMEDLALSLHVGRKYKLFNARYARIFHDSQPGDHKSGKKAFSRMELVNRHFIMTRIMGKKGFINHAKLFLFECWGIASSLTGLNGWKQLLPVLAGKFSAIPEIIFRKKDD